MGTAKLIVLGFERRRRSRVGVALGLQRSGLRLECAQGRLDLRQFGPERVDQTFDGVEVGLFDRSRAGLRDLRLNGIDRTIDQHGHLVARHRAVALEGVVRITGHQTGRSELTHGVVRPAVLGDVGKRIRLRDGGLARGDLDRCGGVVGCHGRKCARERRGQGGDEHDRYPSIETEPCHVRSSSWSVPEATPMVSTCRSGMVRDTGSASRPHPYKHGINPEHDPTMNGRPDATCGGVHGGFIFGCSTSARLREPWGRNPSYREAGPAG